MAIEADVDEDINQVILATSQQARDGELSSAELDAEFMRIDQEQALANNDTRTWAVCGLAYLAGWALICSSFAIDHEAAYVCFILAAIALFFIYGLGLNKINKRRARLVKEFHAATGHKPRYLTEPRSTTIFFVKMTVVVLLAMVGYWVTCVTLNDGHFFLPNGFEDDKKVLFALTMFFGLIVFVLGLFVVLMGLVLVCLHFTKGEPESFNLAVGPEVPHIKQPQYPEMIDCLAPLYVSMAFILLMAIGGYFSQWFYLGVIGVIAAFVPVFRTHFRHEDEERRIKLCFDWHKEHRAGQELDPVLMALRQDHKRVQNKYLNSAACFGLMCMFTAQLVFPRDDRTLADIEWGVWVFLGVLFLACHYMLYRIWRHDLRGVAAGRDVPAGYEQAPTSFSTSPEVRLN